MSRFRIAAPACIRFLATLGAYFVSIVTANDTANLLVAQKVGTALCPQFCGQEYKDSSL